MITPTDIAGRIHAFICKQLAPELEETIERDSELFQLLDSIEVIRIVSFVESEFGIEVDDLEMLPDRVGSIERICDLVEQKQAAT